jgi:hypothetical protein
MTQETSHTSAQEPARNAGNSRSQADNRSQKVDKKQYSRPELRVYGSVVEFTKGTGTSTHDGGTHRFS